MIKKREMTDPKSCLSRAREDEMLFVLLSRDSAAPATILFWINERVCLGKNKLTDPQIKEAFYCARRMESQRESVAHDYTVTDTPTPPMSMEEAHRITKSKLGNPEGIVCCWVDKMGFKCAVGLGGTGRAHRVLGGGPTWEKALDDLDSFLLTDDPMSCPHCSTISVPLSEHTCPYIDKKPKCSICNRPDCETPNQKH